MWLNLYFTMPQWGGRKTAEAIMTAYNYEENVTQFFVYESFYRQ